MMIHDITAIAGAHKKRKRVGRGEGSGHGKTSGRGAKGAGSRSGNAAKKAFEGGQMPYFRRLAKFGFTNAPFKIKFWTVNLGDITAHAAFKNGGTVSAATLIKAGLVRDESRDLKILGSLGKEKGLKVKLNVDASRVSASAKKMIVDAGGSVKESGTRRDRTRGIDLTLSAEDRKPTNLTKKLKRTKPNKGVVAEAEAAEAAGAAEPAAKPKKG